MKILIHEFKYISLNVSFIKPVKTIYKYKHGLIYSTTTITPSTRLYGNCPSAVPCMSTKAAYEVGDNIVNFQIVHTFPSLILLFANILPSVHK